MYFCPQCPDGGQCDRCQSAELWDGIASRCAAVALPAFDAMLLEQTSPARIEKLGELFR